MKPHAGTRDAPATGIIGGLIPAFFMDPQLIREYEATQYHVDRGDAPFVMAIGKRSEELAGLHAERGVSSSAFITAWNPFSQRVGGAENLAKNASLRQELQAAGFDFIPGRGVNPQGLWPPEASFLVLGIDRAKAARIGRRYRQNAIVYAGENAVPELVLLR